MLWLLLQDMPTNGGSSPPPVKLIDDGRRFRPQGVGEPKHAKEFHILPEQALDRVTTAQ